MQKQGVVLRIATGIVHAPGKILRQVPREEVVASIAKHFGISRAIAELRSMAPLSLPLQSAVRWEPWPS